MVRCRSPTPAAARDGYYQGSMAFLFRPRRAWVIGADDHRDPCAGWKALHMEVRCGSCREVLRTVDYIYNRGHETGMPGSTTTGPRRYPERMKGGDSCPDPPRGRLSLAPHLVRQHGVGRCGGHSLANVSTFICLTTGRVMPAGRARPSLQDAPYSSSKAVGLKVRFTGRGRKPSNDSAGTRITPKRRG